LTRVGDTVERKAEENLEGLMLTMLTTQISDDSLQVVSLAAYLDCLKVRGRNVRDLVEGLFPWGARGGNRV
jgi:hypothetical protein